MIDRAATSLMERLHTTSTQALRYILDSQPLCRAKVAFVWEITAGPALARAATVDWNDDGTLILRARTAAWLKEIRRARPTLMTRIQRLLGPDAIKTIVIE